MRDQSLWRQLATAAAVAAIAGCSTADYSKPVDDFAAATKQAETALAELNTQVTNAYSDVLKQSLLTKGAGIALRVSKGDCNVGSERCRLVIVDSSGNQEPYPPEPPLQQMPLVMAEISKYADNLRALLDADTAKNVEAHVNAAIGSVQNIAKTVAKAGGPGGTEGSAPDFATPVGEAVNWLAGQYVERVKYKGLQRATAAAKPVVREAADLFADVASFVSDVPKATLADEVSDAQLTLLTTQRNETKIDKLVASADRYDTLLRAAPVDLFKRLGDAHDALADELAGSQEFSFANVTARIQAFAAEAKQLAKILKDLRAVAAQDKEG